MSSPSVVINSEASESTTIPKEKRKYNFKTPSVNKSKIIKADVINPKRGESFATNEMEQKKQKLLDQIATLEKAIEVMKTLNALE